MSRFQDVEIATHGDGDSDGYDLQEILRGTLPMIVREAIVYGDAIQSEPSYRIYRLSRGESTYTVILSGGNVITINQYIDYPSYTGSMDYYTLVGNHYSVGIRMEGPDGTYRIIYNSLEDSAFLSYDQHRTELQSVATVGGMRPHIYDIVSPGLRTMFTHLYGIASDRDALLSGRALDMIIDEYHIIGTIEEDSMPILYADTIEYGGIVDGIHVDIGTYPYDGPIRIWSSDGEISIDGDTVVVRVTGDGWVLTMISNEHGIHIDGESISINEDIYEELASTLTRDAILNYDYYIGSIGYGPDYMGYVLDVVDSM